MSHPTTDTSSAWRGVWRLASGQRIRYMSAIGASCIANALQLCVPLVGMYAIDVLVEKEFSFANPFLLAVSDALAGERSVVSYLWLSAAAGVLLTGLCGAVLFIRDRLSAVASESLTRSIRESLFRRLHRVPLRFFDDSDTGDLVQRCSSDVETLRVFLHDDVHQMGQAILLVLVMTPVLLWRDAWLTALALSLTPLLLIGAFVFFRKIRHLFRLVDESEGSLTALMQQSLTGIRVIHGFNRYKYETERFGVHNRAFRDKYNRLNKVTAIYWGVSDFIVTIQIGIVLFVGAYFVTHGSLTIGELFLFLSLISIVVWRIRHLGRILTEMGKAIVAVTRIQHVLGQTEEPSGLWPDVERVEGRLSLQDVSLSYDGVNPALDGLNIEIAPGETIGLVGPPGSGKTSFVRALLRLYPISSGRMSIDDFDINAVDPDWLRSQFGVVLQEPFLFSRTVEENLRVGNENASEDEIVDVVDDAALVREISLDSRRISWSRWRAWRYVVGWPAAAHGSSSRSAEKSIDSRLGRCVLGDRFRHGTIDP